MKNPFWAALSGEFSTSPPRPGRRGPSRGCGSPRSLWSVKSPGGATAPASIRWMARCPTEKAIDVRTGRRPARGTSAGRRAAWNMMSVTRPSAAEKSQVGRRRPAAGWAPRRRLPRPIRRTTFRDRPVGRADFADAVSFCAPDRRRPDQGRRAAYGQRGRQGGRRAAPGAPAARSAPSISQRRPLRRRQGGQVGAWVSFFSMSIVPSRTALRSSEDLQAGPSFAARGRRCPSRS